MFFLHVLLIIHYRFSIDFQMSGYMIDWVRILCDYLYIKNCTSSTIRLMFVNCVNLHFNNCYHHHDLHYHHHPHVIIIIIFFSAHFLGNIVYCKIINWRPSCDQSDIHILSSFPREKQGKNTPPPLPSFPSLKMLNFPYLLKWLGDFHVCQKSHFGTFLNFLFRLYHALIEERHHEMYPVKTTTLIKECISSSCTHPGFEVNINWIKVVRVIRNECIVM